MVAAVGDDAALSVFTQLASNAGDGGATPTCGGSRGESRTRVADHLKLGGRFVQYYYIIIIKTYDF